MMPDAVAASVLQVTHERVLSFRASQSHLGHRLPARSYREAAWGGLQDSSPRAALLSLHARLEDAGPHSWEDPSLWQIWLRMSDYVVPRDDFAVFTLGALPRAPRPAAGLIAIGDAVAEIVGDRILPDGEVGAALARRPHIDERTRLHAQWVMREACVSGRYRIRWDARTVTVIAVAVPRTDPEEARLELVRRFLHWHGPATPRQFASWAHVPLVDAVESWRRLTPELLQVTVDGGLRHVLASDEEALRDPPPVRGVRLVPFSDPLFALDRKTLLQVPAAAGDGPARARNRLTGRVLLDGMPAGSWGRREHQLLIWLWGPVPAAVRERVSQEAETFATPLGRPVDIHWLS